MEIQSLKLIVTDADVAALLPELVPKDEKIEKLQAQLTPDGVAVQGEYPTGFGFKVAFDTLWQVVAAGTQFEVTLASIKVAGIPAGMLRGVLLKMIRDAVADQPGVSMPEEKIVIDVVEVAQGRGIYLRAEFAAIQFALGSVLIETV